MKELISVIRTDRKREMYNYDNQGYDLGARPRYILIGKIEVNVEGEKYQFGVQADGYEIYFHIINDGANYYLSIYDIYKVLYQINIREGADYVEKILREQIIVNATHEPEEILYYQGVSYKIHQIVLPKNNSVVMLEDASTGIDYKYLFILLSLIQEKSNALFYKEPEYTNGIYRLLIVLLTKRENIILLNKLGWFWNKAECLYISGSVAVRDARSKKKYYLTNDEYNSII